MTVISSICTVDIYPTFLDLAGLLNEDNALKIDGKSFADILVNGEVEREWREQYLVEYRATGTTYFWICGIWAPDQYGNVIPGVTLAPPQGPPDMNTTGPWYVNDEQSGNFRMLRILNATHNWMYSEFVNWNWTKHDLENPEFYELYDLNLDPYQLENRYYSVDPNIHQQLHHMLATYGSCAGDSCL